MEQEIGKKNSIIVCGNDGIRKSIKVTVTEIFSLISYNINYSTQGLIS